MVNHQVIAARILRQLKIKPSSELLEIWWNKTLVTQTKWDGVGKINNKLVLVEVEPPHPDKEHIYSHVTKAVILSHQENIEKLIWVIYSDSPNCHKVLKSYAECWMGLFRKICKKELPVMIYLNRKGELLS